MLAEKAQLPRELPPPLPGFTHVRRYRHPVSGTVVARVLPGDFYVTREDEILDTVLGSCVSACIRNSRTGVGGMNHFMLPFQRNAGSDSWDGALGLATRYGAASMEQLINRILNTGGTRAELEVKIFGGAQVLSGMSDIGGHNLRFVREFLREEGLKIIAQDVGDIFPRHVRYQPRTGKALMRKLGASQSARIVTREERYLEDLTESSIAGSIDLF
jgi:chemotaxis protein CheD